MRKAVGFSVFVLSAAVIFCLLAGPAMAAGPEPERKGARGDRIAKENNVLKEQLKAERQKLQELQREMRKLRAEMSKLEKAKPAKKAAPANKRPLAKKPELAKKPHLDKPVRKAQKKDAPPMRGRMEQMPGRGQKQGQQRRMDAPDRKMQPTPGRDGELRGRIEQARRRLGRQGQGREQQGMPGQAGRLEQFRKRMQSPEMKKRLAENPELRKKLAERMSALRGRQGREIKRPQRDNARGMRGQMPEPQRQRQGMKPDAQRGGPERIDPAMLKRFKEQLKNELLKEIKQYIDRMLKSARR